MERESIGDGERERRGQKRRGETEMRDRQVERKGLEGRVAKGVAGVGGKGTEHGHWGLTCGLS